jgi:RNA polymerase sigma-70 factor (ECF subfamily)
MWGAADDTLLAGFGMGDADAATAFVRRHQARVFGLARSIVGDSALAEDVAQEAFVRAWRHAGAYDARRGSVVTWLLAITRNLAIDALRLHRPSPVDPARLAAFDLRAAESGATAGTGPADGPAAAAEVASEMVRLRSALAGLPEEQRRAVVLAALCGRTAKEIGESEGIPLGTAKTRIRTGLLRVRQAVGVGREADSP